MDVKITFVKNIWDQVCDHRTARQATFACMAIQLRVHFGHTFIITDRGALAMGIFNPKTGSGVSEEDTRLWTWGPLRSPKKIAGLAIAVNDNRDFAVLRSALFTRALALLNSNSM